MTKLQDNISSDNQAVGTSSDVILEVANLKKGFGKQEVLKNVSLKLFNGENLVVLGKSGSGKSVLIKCIVRLLNPDSGTVDITGSRIGSLNRYELDELRKKIGFLFQSGALYDSMTCLLYTSDAADEEDSVDLGGRRII